MRPISLSISGLHSFREKVTIDFNALCEGGVFGIFGPTGSGKSTILDAMTFALYGKMGRNSAVGVSMINQAEKEASVSYTFQIGGRTYLAERKVKRSNDDKLQTSRSRFVDLTEEPVVLADKVGDMNEYVQELIGLQLSDFTRAVVLPQNKFSEFLQLKGTDRRVMLQRLFNLHKYGDELNDKVREGIQTHKQEILMIEREQQGMGDASKQALEEVRQQAEKAGREVKQESQNNEELDRQFKKAESLVSLQREKEEMENERAKLVEQKQSLQQSVEKKQIHELVVLVQPFLETLEETTNTLNELQQQQKDIDERVTKRSEQHRQAAMRHETAKNERSEYEPSLMMKQQQVEQLLQEQQAFQEIHRKLNDYDLEIKKQAQQVIETTNQKEAIQRTLSNRSSQMATVEDQLMTLLERESHHQHVRDASEAAMPIIQQRSALTEYEQDVKDKEKKRDEERQRYDEVVKERDNRAERLQTAYEYIVNWYNALHELERNRKEHIKTVKQAMSSEQDQLIASLAAHLEEGAACPVCGSVDHPNKHHHQHKGSHEDLEPAYEKLQSLYEATSYQRTLESLSERVRAAITVNDVQIQNDTTEHVTLQRETMLESLQQWMATFEKKVQTVARIESKTETLLQEFNQLNQSVENKTQTVNDYEKQYEEARQRIETKRSEYIQLRDQWYVQFAPLTLDSLEREKTNVRDEEKQIRSLREAQAEWQKEREQLQRDERTLEQQAQALQTEQIKLEHQRETLTKETESFSKKVRELVGEKTLEGVQTEVQEQRNKLEHNETLTAKEVENLASDYENVKNEQLTNQTKREDAVSRKQKAEQNWEEQKQGNAYQKLDALISFERADNLQSYRLTEVEVQQIDEAVERLQQQLSKVELNVERLNEQVGTDTISTDQFEKIVAALQESNERLERLKENRTNMQTALEQLTEKHERYAELEELAKQYEQKLSHFEELERVFRGKEFVDFLAEEQLVQVTKHASERLHTLTRGRYALVLDSSGGFMIADYFNGGEKRPASSLSGGETFLTSLALALSLSASIQLTGEKALEFFFLDEGFGTLDSELLDTVIHALEQLQTDHLAVGVISHVPELQERLQTRLMVTPATAEGKGSTASIEY
ncbi:hypothetical protein DH09_06235 [Bacillaceae bacterium JMAK1]|nr:hypothetical protein DH09_06235 [Bacillaceae bacterium JMAK1]